MKAIKHSLRHALQPTGLSCGQTALSMLLSHYGIEMSPADILKTMPGLVTDDGSEWGTVAPQLAHFCITQGFKATVHTFDCRIIDLSWSEFSAAEILKRLKRTQSTRMILTLGKKVTQRFIKAYLDFLDAKGTLKIAPFVTEKLLDSLLKRGPFVTTVCMGAFYGKGRVRKTGELKGVLDDLKGTVGTHFVVVYGKNAQGKYLIADPGRKECPSLIDRDHLLGSIMAAQRDCENVLFQITK